MELLSHLVSSNAYFPTTPVAETWPGELQDISVEIPVDGGHG